MKIEIPFGIFTTILLSRHLLFILIKGGTGLVLEEKIENNETLTIEPRDLLIIEED